MVFRKEVSLLTLVNTEAAVAQEKQGTTAEALGHNAPASEAFYIKKQGL